MTKQKEIEELELVISTLDTLYEQGDDCIHPINGQKVSNSEYDAMRARLANLDPTNKILAQVTASQSPQAVKKVKHDPPMTSIKKAIGSLDDRNKELERWKRDIVSELHYQKTVDQWACQSYKLDGVALALYYQKGKLVAAGLRPRDGMEGEDVTENAKYVEGIHAILPLPITGTIRGEIICKKSVFEKVNAQLAAAGEKTFANERNYAAGSIRQFKDPTITKDRQLVFVAYSIISDDVTEKDEIERAKWSNKTLKVPYVQTRSFRYEDLKKMEDNAKDLDYEVDGVVVSVRDIDDREQMGHHGGDATKSPKGRLAWKFEEESADPVVKAYEWETGRTGEIIPVLTFDPVKLAGTMVGRCTGHNLGFVQRNKIAVGSMIRVIKSGKIIPKVVSVISGTGDPNHPKQCPSCQHQTSVEKGADGVSLMCNNILCPARAVRTVCHYLKTLGVKGLAESTVQKLYDAQLVANPADLYDLDVDQLVKLNLGERNSRLAIARIHMIPNPEKMGKGNSDLDDQIKEYVKKKKPVALWQFFAALGIEGAGRSAGRALLNHFGSFDKIMNATAAELEAVPDIGSTTSRTIHDFFRNTAIVNRLLQQIDLQMPKAGKLSKYTFCLTGTFPDGKTHWQKQVEDLGGKIATSVSKKVDYVVVGADAGSKADKADELQITKLSLDDLKKML